MVRASLGRDGGAFALRRAASTKTAVKAQYPMYGLRVRDLMAMEQWVPHEELLAQGQLHVIGEEEIERKRVIFVSHQWCSFLHPDPKGDQLKALQVVLKRLIDGEVVVRTNPQLELGYGYSQTDGPKEWQQFFEEGYIWHDFSCIPQPLAHKAKIDGEALTGGRAPHAGLVGADHRSGECGEDEVMAKLVAGLKAAVDSIPSYVERAEFLWVLVPPVAHQDVTDAVCDFNSWRGRGWCRMEYAASNLTTRDLPVMIIKNSVDPPEYFSPCDAMKTPATGGCFSFEEDKSKVLDVLQAMVTHKADHFKAMGDHHLARLIRCFAPMMTGGVDRSAIDTPSVEGESAVDRLKRRIGWRDEATEARWTKETGWNLMTIAAMLDDLAAVKELCARDDAIELMSAKGKKLPSTFGHHRVPFSKMLMNMSNGHLPLMGAMGYASPAVVTTMLEAGCPLPKGAALLDTFCGSPCHRPTGAIFNGRVDNCEAFLAVHPTAVDVSAPGTSSTFWQSFMHIACSIDRPNIKICVEWLLSKGCHKLLRLPMGVGATPLGSLVNNQDADLSVMPILVAADPDFTVADINAYVQPKQIVWGMFHFMRFLSPVFTNAGLTVRMFKEFLCVGTLLHWAAMNGNVPMIAALLDLGADPTIRTKPCTKTPHCKRLTPYELIEHKFPDSAVVTATARLLEAKGYGEVVHGAKINSKRHSLAKNSHASLRDSFKLLSVTPAPAGTGAAEGSDRR